MDRIALVGTHYLDGSGVHQGPKLNARGHMRDVWVFLDRKRPSTHPRKKGRSLGLLKPRARMDGAQIGRDRRTLDYGALRRCLVIS